jgi:hypothetical protein
VTEGGSLQGLGSGSRADASRVHLQIAQLGIYLLTLPTTLHMSTYTCFRH